MKWPFFPVFYSNNLLQGSDQVAVFDHDVLPLLLCREVENALKGLSASHMFDLTGAVNSGSPFLS